MSFRFPSKEAAERFAADRNATAIDDDEYRVEPYPDGSADRTKWPWGVARYHRYSLRPELGWIADGFIWHDAGAAPPATAPTASGGHGNRAGGHSEPWGTLQHHGAQTVIDENGYEFATAVSRERARRIVACVNACAGISNEHLDAGLVRGLCRKFGDEIIAELRNEG